MPSLIGPRRLLRPLTIAKPIHQSDGPINVLEARKPSRRVTKRNAPIPNPNVHPRRMFPLYSPVPAVTMSVEFDMTTKSCVVGDAEAHRVRDGMSGCKRRQMVGCGHDSVQVGEDGFLPLCSLLSALSSCSPFYFVHRTLKMPILLYKIQGRQSWDSAYVL
jgi:hypothetical protein